MSDTTIKYGTAEALAFVNGTGVDATGRTIEDYFNFDADKWEECHNHVQWAFPSHIPSRFNPDAPVVDMADFANGLSVQGHKNINRLLDAYLASLGFTGYRFDPSSPRNAIWLTPYNHNYQRISRILNLLAWIDPELALALLNEFLTAAQSVANQYVQNERGVAPFITVETVVYWSKAAIGGL